MENRALVLRGRSVDLPIFMPDATFGFVRGVTSQDLRLIGIQGLVMNTFHLMQKPGSSTVQALGGLHQMADWDGPIFTDSGGFQAYSLIHQNKKFGSLTDNGIIFRPEGSDRKLQLTPEKCIQLQFGFGSDVLICLDDCTHIDASRADQELSVSRTISWAKRCKNEFNKQLLTRKLEQVEIPMLFAVIQGGGYLDLRKQCIEALLEIGFDGYGFGGWPLDSQGNFLEDLLAYVRELIPQKYLLHALGIGHPKNLITSFNLGYDIFDCAMPTRDARHGRLYVADLESVSFDSAGNWLKYLYINDEKCIKAKTSISLKCDCPCCLNYSLGYLHHLYKMNDSAFIRLATLHNLRFMTRLTARLSNGRN